MDAAKPDFVAIQQPRDPKGLPALIHRHGVEAILNVVGYEELVAKVDLLKLQEPGVYGNAKRTDNVPQAEKADMGSFFYDRL